MDSPEQGPKCGECQEFRKNRAGDGRVPFGETIIVLDETEMTIKLGVCKAEHIAGVLGGLIFGIRTEISQCVDSSKFRPLEEIPV